MGNEPVAFERGDQWLDVALNAGREGGVGQGKECQGGHKDPKGPGLCFQLYDHIEEDNDPRKEYE